MELDIMREDIICPLYNYTEMTESCPLCQNKGHDKLFVVELKDALERMAAMLMDLRSRVQKLESEVD